MASFRIGTTASNLVTLDSLGLPPVSMAAFRDYTDPIELASGHIRGGGWSAVEWRFNYLDFTQIAALRAYCTGASADVYIETLNNAGVWDIYTAVMRWPEEENTPMVDIKTDFVITFAKVIPV
jgi:hypothetical protein